MPPSYTGRLTLLGIAAAAALLAALAMQYVWGLAPCHFCLLERYPYVAVLVLAALGFALRRPRLALALVAVALAVDVGLAAYHVAIEQGWVALPASCAAVGKPATIEELRQELMAPPARCDQVTASLMGLSLAAWNGLYALALFLFALWAALARPGSAAEQDRYPRAA